MNFVYKFINYDNEIIYIGKTSDIKKRMKQHFSSHAHLPKECYEQVYKIYFSNVNSKYNAEILETLLINKYSPIFNKDKKYQKDVSDINIDAAEPEWKELHFLKSITQNNLPNIEFLTSYPPYINRRLMPQECMKKALDYNFRKIQCYKYEFEHACPNILKRIGLKQIMNLYEYASRNLNLRESNIDEYVRATPEEQFKENYIAFNLENMKNVLLLMPDFDLLLKYGIIENLDKNIFIVHFLTYDFLKSLERNYND